MTILIEVDPALQPIGSRIGIPQFHAEAGKIRDQRIRGRLDQTRQERDAVFVIHFAADIISVR